MLEENHFKEGRTSRPLSKQLRSMQGNLYEFQDALEALFARRADLLTAITIRNKYLRAEIESTQETLYAA